MGFSIRKSLFLYSILSTFCLFAASSTVTNTDDTLGEGSLRQALIDINNILGAPDASNTITITTGGTLTLTSILPLVFNNLAGKSLTMTGPVDGSNHPTFIVNGNSAYRGLLVTPPLFTGEETLNITINNLSFVNTQDKGGDGGGGAASLGGALFVGTGANVTLNNVIFSGAAATGGTGLGANTGINYAGGGGMSGGNGGTASGGNLYPCSGGGIAGNGTVGGGGGLGSPGGANQDFTLQSSGGGGGGLPATQGGIGTGAGANGTASVGGDGGGFNEGLGGTSSDGQPTNGGLGGGGGGAYPSTADGFSGGAGGLGGGGGAGAALMSGAANGGNGGFGGGGGAPFVAIIGVTPASGGWGGGGAVANGSGGNGGFGGGGGGGNVSIFNIGQGGFGGGDGNGSGGSAFGGAIFVQTGGNLTIGDATFTGSSVTGGSYDGGNFSTAGIANGYDIYLHGTANLTITGGIGNLQAIGGNQEGVSSNGTITVANGGFVSFVGSQQTSNFDGTFYVQGRVTFLNDSVFGSGASTLIVNGGTLNYGNISGGTGWSKDLSVGTQGATLSWSIFTSKTYSGNMSGSGPVTVHSNFPGSFGVVNLTGNNSNLSGGITIVQDTTVVISSSQNLGSGTVTFNNGNLQTSGSSLTLNQNLNFINSLGGTVNVPSGTLTHTGVLSGSAPLSIKGAGALVFAGTSSFTGNVFITAGMLETAAANIFSSSSSNVSLSNVSGATLNLNGFSATIGALSGGGSLGGNITLGNSGSPVLTTGNSINSEYDGIISGAGSVIKQGSGTLIFSKVHTYSEATTISAGKIALIGSGSISNSNALTVNGIFDASALANTSIQNLSGGGTIQMPSTLLTLTQNSALIYSGVLNGTGGITQTGTGSLTLSGNNQYAGPTTITSGTIALAGSGSISNSNALTVNGIFDASAVVNTAIQNLSGNGTVHMPSGLLTITQNSALMYSGVLIGSGGITQIGTGSLTLSSAHAYTGPTTITSGTLVLSGSGDISSSNALTVNGVFDASALTNTSIQNLSGSGIIHMPSNTLTVTQASNLTYSGSIEGAGGLIQNGTGTLTLSSANGYTGLTVINEGTLVVNGSIAGNLSIGGLGNLKGTGVIQGGGVSDISGNIRPGNSIGTITFNGNLTFNPSAITTIEIDGQMSAAIVVGGTATTGGSLALIFDSSFFYAGTRYTILAAGSVDNTTPFNFTSPPGFVFDLEYSPATVELVLVHYGLNTTGISGNQLVLANYFDNVVFPTLGLLPEFLDLIAMPDNVMQNALNTISPSRNAFNTFASQNVLIDLSDQITSRLSVKRYERLKNRLDYVDAGNDIDTKSLIGMAGEDSLLSMGYIFQRKEELPSPEKEKTEEPIYIEKRKNETIKHHFWTTGLGNFSQEKASLQNPKFYMQSAGVLVGCDTLGIEERLLGVAGGYVFSTIDQYHSFGKNQFNGGYLTIYSHGYLDNFYLEGALWGGYQRMKDQRQVFYPGFNARAESCHSSYQIDPHFSIGYDHYVGSVIIEPFATLDWVFNFEDAFQESGAAPFNMRQPHKRSSMGRGEVGLSFMNGFQVRDGMFIIRGKGSYVCKAFFGTGNIDAALVGVPAFFTVESLTGSQSLGVGSLELTWRSNQGGYFSAFYMGEFGSGYMSNQFTASLGKNF